MHHLFFWRPLVSFRPQPVGRGWGTIGVCLDVVCFCFYNCFVLLVYVVCSNNMFFGLIDMLLERCWPWTIHLHLEFLEDCPRFCVCLKVASRMFSQIFRDRTACFRKLSLLEVRNVRTKLWGSECDLIWRWRTSVCFETPTFSMCVSSDYFSIVKQYLMACYSNVLFDSVILNS